MEPDCLAILVVDDSATMRQLIRMMLLQHLPCRVEEAGDGREAAQKLEEGRFDLVITDINMPVMDGLSLVSDIRGRLRSPVPVIIVTTRGGEKDRDEGLRRGATSYIAKPINSLRLINAVREALA